MEQLTNPWNAAGARSASNFGWLTRMSLHHDDQFPRFVRLCDELRLLGRWVKVRLRRGRMSVGRRPPPRSAAAGAAPPVLASVLRDQDDFVDRSSSSAPVFYQSLSNTMRLPREAAAEVRRLGARWSHRSARRLSIQRTAAVCAETLPRERVFAASTDTSARSTSPRAAPRPARRRTCTSDAGLARSGPARTALSGWRRRRAAPACCAHGARCRRSRPATSMPFGLHRPDRLPAAPPAVLVAALPRFPCRWTIVLADRVRFDPARRWPVDEIFPLSCDSSGTIHCLRPRHQIKATFRGCNGSADGRSPFTAIDPRVRRVG